MLILFSTVFSTACTADKHWSEEALLSGGRVIEVKRSVAFHFGHGEPSQAWSKWPDQYKIETKNPNTGRAVTWSGEQYFNPLALDFIAGDAYLVAYASDIYANLKQYGCPEIPYVFFWKAEAALGWTQIHPRDFPVKFLHANLSMGDDGYSTPSRGRLSKDAVDQINHSSEVSSSGYVSREIPTTFWAWKSMHKNSYRVNHQVDGCRHTVPSNDDPTHVQAQGRPAQPVDLETIVSILHSPERVIPTDSADSDKNFRAAVLDSERKRQCNTYIKRVPQDSDQPELRGWLLFVNDPSGLNKARDTAAMYCDETALWFQENVYQEKRVVLTKFSLRGDFSYRISFAYQDLPDGYGGVILQPTFRRSAGYVYFDLWNAYRPGKDWLIKREMKLRFKEPTAALPGVTSN
jgi:hypothetical protein